MEITLFNMVDLNEEFDDFSNEFGFCIFTDEISIWNRPFSVVSMLKTPESFFFIPRNSVTLV